MHAFREEEQKLLRTSAQLNNNNMNLARNEEESSRIKIGMNVFGCTFYRLLRRLLQKLGLHILQLVLLFVHIKKRGIKTKPVGQSLIIQAQWDAKKKNKFPTETRFEGFIPSPFYGLWHVTYTTLLDVRDGVYCRTSTSPTVSLVRMVESGRDCCFS